MPLIPGTRLGPYEILAPIGAGGMGEVYKALDTRLDRIVAIKTSRTQFSERFGREARAIAALNHPHICQLYDVGPNYLVMEYVDGVPLKGPLPVEQAMKYAAQICDALGAAHGKGITHRDLKPANILVTKAGVKLLDFGMAKIEPANKHLDDATMTLALTRKNEIVGTPSYMSPEQAEAKEVDARSDIFSFGLVFYEMLCGRRAFQGDSAIAVMAAILHNEPAALDAPAEIRDIVTRCLRKSPAERFQFAAEIRAALESAATAKPAAEKRAEQASIAVLPFANMSADKENEYFSDGLAEEVINELAQIPGLKVIARTSSFAFRGKEQDIRGIATTLGVANILEGSVRRAGDRIRVTAQLIAAADGSHLWSQRYDREMADVFAIQDEIAQAITAALKLKLAAKSADVRRHKPSLPAYEAFLKGKHYLFLGTPESLGRAREYLEQAIALDPEFAEPHAELGTHYLVFGIWGARPAGEMMQLARTEALKALALSPGEPRAHGLLGSVAALYDYNWREADEQFRIALAADNVPPEVRLRNCLTRLASGRTQNIIEEMERVLEQDPLNVLSRSLFAMSLNGVGMYERATVEAQKALEIDGRAWPAQFQLAQSYALRGMLAEAKQWAEAAYRPEYWNGTAAGLLAGIYTLTGDKERAEAMLGELQSPGRVVYHTLCSELDAAADWYKKAIERREAAILTTSMGIAKPLRESPYWPELAKLMNLPETG